jgi:hypothetical protein
MAATGETMGKAALPIVRYEGVRLIFTLQRNGTLQHLTVSSLLNFLLNINKGLSRAAKGEELPCQRQTHQSLSRPDTLDTSARVGTLR